AVGSNGTPDFSPAERKMATDLFDSPHVIQEQVASHAGERRSRFEDVNLAIVKSSDVVVCLFRADADSKPGGTQHLLELAKKRGGPALEIRVALVEGKPHFTETWHNLDGYRPPQLPAELANLPGSGSGDPTPLPSAEEYCAALKTFSSDEARGWKQWFRY